MFINIMLFLWIFQLHHSVNVILGWVGMVGKLEVLTGLSLGRLEVKYSCLKGNFKVTPTGLLLLS